MLEQLPGGWTLERLKAKTPEERFTVWQNARRLGTPDALSLARYIETCGLDFAERGGMSLNDPRAVEMQEIIESPEGRAACLAATEKGLPAMAGVEPLIIAQMGSRYGAFNQMTNTAGALVGTLMMSLGYRLAGRGNMPQGAVAQTAATWRKL
jgi:hypothetical protein